MKPIKITPLVVILLCFSLPFTSTARAEDAENDADRVKRTKAAERVTAAVSEAAEKRALPELGEISFEQIKARPDDVKLNFLFAKQQVAQHDMLGAAGTLERILIVDPSLDQVRMFYAVVLFRLDNLVEAQSEFDTLSKKKLPGALQAELKRYQKEIKKRKRRTHLALRQSNGWGFDSNRNAIPSSKKRLFGNTLLNIAHDDRSRRDTNFLNITTMDVVHDLPFQGGHQLIGSFTYFLQEQTYLDSLDLSSTAFSLGGVYKTHGFNITPLFTSNYLLLSRQNFLRTQGGSLLVDRNFFNGRLNVFNLNNLEYQDYRNIAENRAGDERRGNEYDLKQGATFGIIPTMNITTAVGYSHKEAKADYNAYDRMTLETDHVWIWPKGQFVINGISVGFDEYDEPDLALASRERHDRTFRYHFTYGVPLGTVFLPIKKIVPEQIKDVTFTFTYEYYRALSNLTNYTYHNNKIQLLFSKRWEF